MLLSRNYTLRKKLEDLSLINKYLFSFDGLSIKIIFLSFVGIGLQITSITLIMKLVSALESGGELNVLGYGLGVISQLADVVLLFLFILVLFFVSSFAIYLSNLLILKKSEKAERNVLDKCVSCIMEYSVPVVGGKEVERSYISLKSSAARLPRPLGRVVLIYASSLINIVKFCLFGLAAFWLNFQMSAVLVVLFSFAFAFYYRYGRLGIAAAEDMFSTNAKASRFKFETIDEMFVMSVVSSLGDKQNSVQGGVNDTNIRSYFDGIKYVKKNELVSNIFKGIGMALVGGYIAFEITKGELDVASSVVYLLFVQLSLAGFQSVVTMFGSINRYHPLLVEYFEIIKQDRVPSRFKALPQTLEDNDLRAALTCYIYGAPKGESVCDVFFEKGSVCAAYVDKGIYSPELYFSFMSSLKGSHSWQGSIAIGFESLNANTSEDVYKELEAMCEADISCNNLIVFFDQNVASKYGLDHVKVSAIFSGVPLVYVYSDFDSLRSIRSGYLLVPTVSGELYCIQGVKSKVEQLPSIVSKLKKSSQGVSNFSPEEEF